MIAATALIAGCGGDARRTVVPTPRPCSAAGLSPSLPAQELPEVVASRRDRIAGAAVRCHYAALGRIGRGVRYSFGEEGDAAGYWRRREDAGEPVLRQLVRILATASAVKAGVVTWPAIATKDAPSDADWDTLAGVYPSAQIERMKQDQREQGVGYLGYRVGISQSGDWLFFVAGD